MANKFIRPRPTTKCRFVLAAYEYEDDVGKGDPDTAWFFETEDGAVQKYKEIREDYAGLRIYEINYVSELVPVEPVIQFERKTIS